METPPQQKQEKKTGVLSYLIWGIVAFISVILLSLVILKTIGIWGFVALIIFVVIVTTTIALVIWYLKRKKPFHEIVKLIRKEVYNQTGSILNIDENNMNGGILLEDSNYFYVEFFDKQRVYIWKEREGIKAVIRSTYFHMQKKFLEHSIMADLAKDQIKKQKIIDLKEKYEQTFDPSLANF